MLCTGRTLTLVPLEMFQGGPRYHDSIVRAEWRGRGVKGELHSKDGPASLGGTGCWPHPQKQPVLNSNCDISPIIILYQGVYALQILHTAIV